MTTVAALWWAYLDVVAIVGERKLRDAEPHEQVLMARDSYTYVHMPIVGGIVVFAIGVKQTLLDHAAHLHAVPATALCGGVALYLLALSVFKRRNIGSFNYPRLVAAAIVLALIPLVIHIQALIALALVTAVVVGLVVYEYHRYAEARTRIRAGA
jgi:low temperature requirement protein LtrA